MHMSTLFRSLLKCHNLWESPLTTFPTNSPIDLHSFPCSLDDTYYYVELYYLLTGLFAYNLFILQKFEFCKNTMFHFQCLL